MLAALTMILGNVIAVVQPNIKRMLAYSSIAHAGYIAVAFAANSNRGGSAALFYTLAYAAMNLGAFAIVTMLGRSEDAKVKFTDYAGLAFEAAGTGGAAVTVPAFAGRRSRNGWLCRQVFHLSDRPWSRT